MAFSELIKNFSKIRDYMRDFYVYGFKSRNDFDAKSARSYDDEKRRIESWLGDKMAFHNTRNGKNVFISIDSRAEKHNPLYKAFKTKSFTDKDITLHFILFDILRCYGVRHTLKEILFLMDTEYLWAFPSPMSFDESTVRKKLKEYEELGLVKVEKEGKMTLYSRNKGLDEIDIKDAGDIISFFSEAGQLGVVGSTLLDKGIEDHEYFTYKHHYITDTFESEILLSLFEAMQDRREVEVTAYSRKKKKDRTYRILPLKIYVSVQTGRRYVLGKRENSRDILILRLDLLKSVKILDVCEGFEEARERLEKLSAHMWGISGEMSEQTQLDHVEFTIHIGEKEQHIWNRLEREKRNGRIEWIDENTARFICDVYDSGEMIPWIRSFTCRISDLKMSNINVEKRIRNDFREMYEMYGIGGEEDDIQ